MKKIKLVVLSIGLVVTFSGCAANEASEQVNIEQEMTIVNDELVSTSDKVVEEKQVNNSIEKADENSQSKMEEVSEDRESIQTDKNEVKEPEEVEAETEVEDDTVQNSTAYTDGAVSKEDFAIQIGSVLVCTGDDINTLVEQLGTPDDFVQARSCLYDGDDKVYTYGGIAIYTYPNGAEDIVYLIEVTGSEKLLSDVGVGSTIADITQAYGNDYVEFGTMLSYDLSETASISFQIENDVVTFIEIYNE